MLGNAEAPRADRTTTRPEIRDFPAGGDWRGSAIRAGGAPTCPAGEKDVAAGPLTWSPVPRQGSLTTGSSEHPPVASILLHWIPRPRTRGTPPQDGGAIPLPQASGSNTTTMDRRSDESSEPALEAT